MNQPSPFIGTEDFYRACISEAVETLRFPLCPILQARTERELDIYIESLRELEAARDWVGVR